MHVTASSQMNCGMPRFVLDIRNNGGGLFPAGVEVARMWVPTGDLVLIADATGVRDTYEASGNALDASSPLVVLVNRGTASASEVVSALGTSRQVSTMSANSWFMYCHGH